MGAHSDSPPRRATIILPPCPLMNILLGVVGAAIADWLFGFLGVTFAGWIGYLIAGFIGACILIVIGRAFSGGLQQRT